MLGSLQESNDEFFHKGEYIKEYCIVSVRYRKGGNHYFGEYKNQVTKISTKPF